MAAKHFRVKNGRFGSSANPHPMKKRGAEGQKLHISATFVHVFCSYFATFRVFVSTPNFQKSTPNFQKALTFFLNEALFLQKQNQPTDNQSFIKTTKNVFFRPKAFSCRIFKI